MVADPLRVALRVAEIFESLNIPYLVGGAVASAVLGEPRSTEDIDVVADIGSDQADALISALGDEFYIPVDALRRAILHRSSCNVVHLETMRKVDIFVGAGRGAGADPAGAGGAGSRSSAGRAARIEESPRVL